MSSSMGTPWSRASSVVWYGGVTMKTRHVVVQTRDAVVANGNVAVQNSIVVLKNKNDYVTEQNR